jgi:hypothetical protein
VYRDTFRALGGFHPGLGANDDWDLYLRVTRAVPVALSDRICSHHYLEKDKPHLTTAGGQVEAQMRVIERVRAAAPWSDLRTRAVLRRRLGAHHKTLGDGLVATDRRAAWREYLRAFGCWPFDHVVAARALVLWPLKMLLGRPARTEARP